MANSLAPLLHSIAVQFGNHPAAIARQVVEILGEARAGKIDLPGQTTAITERVLPTLTACSGNSAIESLITTHHQLAWRTPLTDKIPAKTANRMAFCEIIGPDGMISHGDCRLGTFIQDANVSYDLHSHAAEELYIALSGTAVWQRSGETAVERAPVAYIHHAPWQSHATYTNNEVLVALWAWVGDLSFDTYRMD